MFWDLAVVMQRRCQERRRQDCRDPVEIVGISSMTKDNQRTQLNRSCDLSLLRTVLINSKHGWHEAITIILLHHHIATSPSQSHTPAANPPKSHYL